MQKKIKVDIMDIGNTVVCDFCNENYTNSEEQGGCLIGSYAICPKCEKDIEHRGGNRPDVSPEHRV